eukprot:6193373-Pleurochrysis_carterae.AAC.1
MRSRADAVRQRLQKLWAIQTMQVARQHSLSPSLFPSGRSHAQSGANTAASVCSSVKSVCIRRLYAWPSVRRPGAHTVAFLFRVYARVCARACVPACVRVPEGVRARVRGSVRCAHRAVPLRSSLRAARHPAARRVSGQVEPRRADEVCDLRVGRHAHPWLAHESAAEASGGEGREKYAGGGTRAGV